MIEAIKFAIFAFRAYRAAKRTGGVQYGAVTRHGVPQVVLLCATDREAWRISQCAIEVLEKQ